MENTLKINSYYSFTSNSKQNCIGEYLGKDENSNILIKIDHPHPFKVNKDGIAVFCLSHYFFFRYFNPILIN